MDWALIHVLNEIGPGVPGHVAQPLPLSTIYKYPEIAFHISGALSALLAHPGTSPLKTQVLNHLLCEFL